MKVIAWRILCFWLCSSSLMGQSLKGDLGDWSAKRYSMGITATNFTKSSAAVANALIQARSGNIHGFTNCFLFATNDSNSFVTEFYYELRQSLKYYQYLVLHEAELQGVESNSVSAVSVVPAGMTTGNMGYANVS